jgi:multiple antibiotic resistance protein
MGNFFFSGWDNLVHLIILFLVIFDPLASFVIFHATTHHLDSRERNRIATYAVLIALILSYTVLLFGQSFLVAFNITLSDFKVACGLVLGLLGIQMALGKTLGNLEEYKDKTGYGIAAIIGTPLLTGPAAISTIIVAGSDYGIPVTAMAIAVVLALTALLFYQSALIHRLVGETPTRVITTFLGLITIAWGVKFIREGLGF